MIWTGKQEPKKPQPTNQLKTWEKAEIPQFPKI